MEEELKVDNVPGDDRPNDNAQLDKTEPKPQQPLNEWANDVDDLGDNSTAGKGGKAGEGWANDVDDPGDNSTAGKGGKAEEGWANDVDDPGDNSTAGKGGKAEEGWANDVDDPGDSSTAGAGNLAGDEIVMGMGKLMANTMDTKIHGGEEQTGNGDPFDKLEDLAKKKAQKESRKGRKSQKENKAGEGKDVQEQDADAQGDTPQAVKKSVDNLREGKLYMAVVLARQLERGGQNPMASNKFKRFFKSSNFDSAADKFKLVGSLSVAAGQLDAQYQGSFVSKAVSLVTNMVGFVAGVKAFVPRARKFKTIQGKNKKVMEGIGLLSDFAQMMSKGVLIAQAIAGFAGANEGLFKKVTGYMTAIFNGISQIAGVVTGINGLNVARGKLKKMKDAENERWEEVEKILPKYSQSGGDGSQEDEKEEEGGQDVSTSNEDQNASEANKGQETQAGTGKKKNRLRAKMEQSKQREKMMKERQSLANMLLRREDIRDEDKDKAVSYLALRRKIKIVKSNVGMGLSGLVVNAIGLASSITNITLLSGEENAQSTSVGLGAAAAFGGAGLTAAKIGLDKSNQKKQNSEETAMIKGRLWSLIHGLDDDKFGLKGISESLEADPSPEKAEEAKGVVNKYKAVDGQLQGAFVEYEDLFKAKDAEEFRNLLVSAI